MIITILTFLNLAIAPVRDTTYIKEQDMVTYKNYEQVQLDTASLCRNNILPLKVMMKKVVDSPIFRTLFYEIPLHPYKTSDNKQLKWITTNFYLDKKSREYRPDHRDSLEMNDYISSCELYILGTYHSTVVDSISHTLCVVNYPIVKGSQYQSRSTRHILLLLSVSQLGYLKSIVRLNETFAGQGYGYDTIMNKGNIFTVYRYDGWGLCNVDPSEIRYIPKKERKAYLNANPFLIDEYTLSFLPKEERAGIIKANPVKIRYQKFKIDEGGHVVLLE